MSWKLRTRCRSHEVSDRSNRYQWLNHYALFSGGYREDALECMEKLVEKYGKKEESEDDSNLSKE